MRISSFLNLSASLLRGHNIKANGKRKGEFNLTGSLHKNGEGLCFSEKIIEVFKAIASFGGYFADSIRLKENSQGGDSASPCETEV